MATTLSVLKHVIPLNCTHVERWETVEETAERFGEECARDVVYVHCKGLIFRKAYEDAGFYLSGCCIWKKNALVLGRSPYQWIHEPWYVDGDNRNGESSKARKAAFNTDFTFNIAEYFAFCNRLLKKEPKTGGRETLPA